MTGTWGTKALWVVDCVISAGFSESLANHGFYVNGCDRE
jgi:hypothetical protein